jgi:hypothetical protein
MPESADARDAAYGEKMIEIKVRFWTNNLTRGQGKVRPKHAWTSGVVRIERNDSHDIVPKSPVPFNSMGEIAAKIEKVLIDHGIALHRSDRMAKYLA